MIQKVNRPAFLSLVATAKQTENDPGSSQGSGLFYDGPPPEQQQAEKQSSPETVPDEETTATKPKLSVVAHEKMGMSDVIKDLLEAKKEVESTPGARAGLAIKYSVDGATAKGLLLNKKVE